MQDYKKLIINGYSGHSYEIIEVSHLMNLNIAGYTDIIEKNHNPFNLKYLGNEKEYKSNFFNKYIFFVCIGDNKTRTSLSNYIRSKSGKIVNIIHPSSLLSDNIKLGLGVFISKNVSINSFSRIDDDVIINTSATLEHECVILSGAHIGPGTVLLGNVKVGKYTLIGAIKD